MKKVRMAEGQPNFAGGDYVTLTFCVTQDCNLACTYCYMEKNNKHRMTLETGKKIVDFILADDYIASLSDTVAFDFIGGEPLLEMELIRDLSDYIEMKLYTMKHKWFHSYTFTFSSNGLLYGEDIVREYVKKHGKACSFGFSIDGTPEKHNLTRVKRDGTGSYDDMAKNFEYYFSEFPDSGTKSTFASDDLPYLRDSIIHLWNLGIKDVASNLVYEDVWKPGDPELFEEQLKSLADYVIDKKMYDDYSVAYFQASTGLPVGTIELISNRCGAGYKSLAFDSEGKIYPCVHFVDMCISDPSKQKFTVLGDIYTGINKDRLVPYAASTWKTVSPQKCMDCDVGANCGWCLAVNVEAKDGRLLKRTTDICEMQKANARASDYFWARYERETGNTSPRTIAKVSKHGTKGLKYMFFITRDSITPHCSYKSKPESNTVMSADTLQAGLDFCIDHQIMPVFIGKISHGLNGDKKSFFEILDRDDFTVDPIKNDSLVVFSTDNITYESVPISIFLSEKNRLISLTQSIKSLLSHYKRVNLFFTDMETWTQEDYALYKKQIIDLAEYIADRFKAGEKPQLNVLTDELYRLDDDYSDCGAGINAVSLAPNGKLYICPGFYFDDPDTSIGSLESFNHADIFEYVLREKSGVCIDCKAQSCTRCLYNNKISTTEPLVPSDMQCKVTKLNHSISTKIRKFVDGETERLILNDDIDKDYISYIYTHIVSDENRFKNVVR